MAGIVRGDPKSAIDEEALLRMARAIRHRGPDGFGLAIDEGAGLVCTRLAIFDLPRGWQPLEAAPGGGLLVYNGEVYNHYELRRDLIARGESFRTTSDTEVVLRLLEREGLAALERLNGQFAFAWWQPTRRRLTLVRDRFGVRPLYYALLNDGSLIFGSEAKAIFASGELKPQPDLAGIDEVFTLWGARAPRTVFRGVHQVPPGGLLVWEAGRVTAERRWWTADQGAGNGTDAELEELLHDSVSLRLRADVQVGSYLSGGLDSSLISALAQAEKQGALRTFSIAFRDPGYDERAHQERVARALGTSHHVVEVGPAEIADALPDVVRHAETPMVRSAPVPLFLLSREVRRQGLKVVATGEGADELFWGYDLFKEVAVRELHRRDPAQARAVIERMYPYLGSGARRGPAFARFLLETGALEDPLGSHMTRVMATGAVKAFYRPEVAAELTGDLALGRLRAELPSEFARWSALQRAAWLELTTLMEPNLLSTQGDRVAMAHGVEGRFPFLDHRVFALSTSLPEERKLQGLEDKLVLRELAAKLLPASIASRAKQPYRAPEVSPFIASGAPDWVEELLSAPALDAAGLWDAERVAGLLRRCRAGRPVGVREGMAFVGILTFQLWHREFVARGGRGYEPEAAEPRVRIDRTRDDRREEAA